MNGSDQRHSTPVEIAVAVVEDSGRFLIGLRNPQGPLPGLWEFPGGKIEPGESPQNAAIRECLEETGLLVRTIGSYPQTAHDYEHASVHLHFFSCTPVEQQRPLADRFRWVAAGELPRYAFPAANAELVRALVGSSRLAQ